MGEADCDWWDNDWKQRVPVYLNETNGIAQGEFVVDLWFDFSRYEIRNATIETRVTFYNPATNSEIERPLQIAGERNNGTKCFEARVLFLTANMDANDHHLYYIYFDNPSVQASSPLYTDFNPEIIKNRLLNPVYENNNYDFSGPTDVAIDSEGNIYIVDKGNHRVQIFDQNSSYKNTLGVSREGGCDSCTFSYPTGIGISANNIFVADTNNHRVQVYGINGVFQMTLGTSGIAGSNNSAFDSPKDVAIGSDGKIYVADYGNHRIQVFNNLADNIADSTIGLAGTSGTNNSVFNYPYSVAINEDKIYVSDSANHRVQILNMDGAWNSTIGTTGALGSTNALFFYPYGISVASDGKLYVADHKNNRVQIFQQDGTYSSTIGVTGQSGSGTLYLNTPYNVAVTETKIFIADYGNNRVQVFSISGDFLSTLGSRLPLPERHTDFNDPRDVTIDDDGRIFICDRKNHRVQVFDSDYSFLFTIGTSGIAGDLHTHLNGPYDVDIGDTMVAIADAYNARVQLFDLNGNYVGTLMGNGTNQYNEPCGVLIDDANERIFVADTYAERVHVYNLDLDYITTFYGGDPKFRSTESGMADGNITFKHPYDVELGPDGKIYALDTDHQVIQVYYGNNYTYSHTLCDSEWDPVEQVWNGDTLQWACGFDIYGDYIYVADTYNSQVKKLDLNGNLISSIGVLGVSGSDNEHLARPRGVGVGPDGSIFVADADNNRVQVFSANLTFSKSISTSGLAIFDNKHLNAPEAVTTDSSNNIYFADTNNHRVQVFDYKGAYKYTLGSSSKREAGSDNEHLSIPSGVAVSSNKVYVADKGNVRIQVFTFDGVYSNTLSIDCYDVKVGGPYEYLFATHSPNHCVHVYTPNGVLVQTLGTPGASGTSNSNLNFPLGVGISPDGKVYVADSKNHRIQVYNDLSDGIADDTIGETGVKGEDANRFSNPNCAAYFNGKLYVADTGNQRIQVFNATTKSYLSTIGVSGKTGSDNVHFNNPAEIIVGNDGKIYVADQDNNRAVIITDVDLTLGSVASYVKPITEKGELIPLEWLVIIVIALIIVVITTMVLRARKQPIAESAEEKEEVELPVSFGHSYLIEEEKPTRSFEILSTLSGVEYNLQGVHTFLIGRTPPQEIVSEYGHTPRRMLWLSRVNAHMDNVESINSSPLPPILDKILTFIEEHEKPAIMLEGIEHLILENNFNDVLKLLDSLVPNIATHKGILLIPIDKRTLSEKELSLLERQMRKISTEEEAETG